MSSRSARESSRKSLIGVFFAAVYRVSQRFAERLEDVIRRGQGSGTRLHFFEENPRQVLMRADGESLYVCVEPLPHARVSAPPLGVPSEWVRWLNRVRFWLASRDQRVWCVYAGVENAGPDGARYALSPVQLRYGRLVEEFYANQSQACGRALELSIRWVGDSPTRRGPLVVPYRLALSFTMLAASTLMGFLLGLSVFSVLTGEAPGRVSGLVVAAPFACLGIASAGVCRWLFLVQRRRRARAKHAEVLKKLGVH
jgi:hypothetical protein